MEDQEKYEVATVGPSVLISQAIQGGADLEKMEKLLELQERWEANEAKKAYHEAMSHFREDCPTINRTRTGHNTKYAGLAETLEVIQPILSKHGLSHQWKTKTNGEITVSCTVTHRLGHSETTEMTASPDTSGSKNAIQAVGSTVAYLERYTFYAILGLASREMDDDGNASGSPIAMADAKAVKEITDKYKKGKGNPGQFQGWLEKLYNVSTPEELTLKQAKELIKTLDDRIRSLK